MSSEPVTAAALPPQLQQMVMRREGAPAVTTAVAPQQPRQEVTRLKNAVSDFEALYLQQMLQAMRRTVPEGKPGELFQAGNGEKLFREMLDGEYAKMMSRRPNGMGVKEMMLRHLTQKGGMDAYRSQEAAQAVGKLQADRQAMQAAGSQMNKVSQKP